MRPQTAGGPTDLTGREAPFSTPQRGRDRRRVAVKMQSRRDADSPNGALPEGTPVFRPAPRGSAKPAPMTPRHAHVSAAPSPRIALPASDAAITHRSSCRGSRVFNAARVYGPRQRRTEWSVITTICIYIPNPSSNRMTRRIAPPLLKLSRLRLRDRCRRIFEWSCYDAPRRSVGTTDRGSLHQRWRGGRGGGDCRRAYEARGPHPADFRPSGVPKGKTGPV